MFYLARVLLESMSGLCGGGVEGGGGGVDCSAEYRLRPAVRDSSVTEKTGTREVSYGSLRVLVFAESREEENTKYKAEKQVKESLRVSGSN